MSKDPIGFDSGDWNLYRYVGNGVVNAVDAMGLSRYSECPFCKNLRKILEELNKQLNLLNDLLKILRNQAEKADWAWRIDLGVYYSLLGLLGRVISSYITIQVAAGETISNNLATVGVENAKVATDFYKAASKLSRITEGILAVIGGNLVLGEG